MQVNAQLEWDVPVITLGEQPLDSLEHCREFCGAVRIQQVD
jgi:hypothetical protein